MSKKPAGVTPSRLFGEVATKAGLIRSVIDPGTQRAHPRDCGVSLGWLEHVCRAILDVREGTGLQYESTAVVMQRILMPSRAGR